jgi:CRP-like cAMP-binding protein
MQMGSLATIREADLPSARPESLRPDRLGLDAEVEGLITALRGGGQPVIVKRGQALFSAGDLAEAVFCIDSGLVRTSMMLPDGRRQIIGFHEAGDLLGFTLSGRHVHSAEAVTTAKLQAVSRLWLQNLFGLRPDLGLNLIQFAARSIDAAGGHAVLLGRMTARERLCAFLLERLKGESGTVQLPMSRIDIADYLGLTIETVSRTLTQLRGEGVIETATARGVEVIDRGRLVDCLEARRHNRCAAGHDAERGRASMRRAGAPHDRDAGLG